MVGCSENEMPRSKRSMRWATISACMFAFTACEAEEPAVNAAQQSRIDNAMEEVGADQARSDVNVAEVRASEDLERRVARDKQEAAAEVVE
jgi:hypothetical protein